MRCIRLPARISRLLLLLMTLFAGSMFAAELQDVRAQLVQELATAQRELSTAEAEISAERGALAQRLNTAQNRVLDLRERAVAARRLADEETLSLGQIEARLDTWRQQSLFQGRLVAAYLQRNGQRAQTDAGAITFEQDLASLAAFLAEQQNWLYPDWRNATLAMPDGQLRDASLLRLGPVTWFWQADLDQSGLARADGNVPGTGLLFDGQMHAGIQGLSRDGVGSIAFDPTLSPALLVAPRDETVLEHLASGGLWVVPILLFALFATVIAVGKGIWLFRLPALMPALAERVEAAMKAAMKEAMTEESTALPNLVSQVKGAQAELLQIALTTADAEQRDERLYAALLQQRNRLESWLSAIAMTASVAPLLGLLGTVSGMITTFKDMTLSGAGDASSVSAGISVALVTTQMGLVVAVPALLAHALMSRKVKSYFSQLENAAVHLSQLPVQPAVQPAVQEAKP